MQPRIFIAAAVALVAVLAMAQVPHAPSEWESGLAAYRAGEWETAAGHFRQVMGTNPDYTPAYTMLGRCLLQLGEPVEARGVFQEALKRNPGDGDATVGLVRAMLEAGKRGESLPQALEVDVSALDAEHRAAVALLLAKAAEHVGRPADALPRVTAEAEANPASAALQKAAARLSDITGDKAAAAKFYLRAYALQPESETLGRVAISRALGAASEAESPGEWHARALEAARILAARPGASTRSLVLAAHAALAAGEPAQAVTWLRAAHQAAPEDAQITYRLASALTEAGEAEEAETLVTQALAGTPDPDLAKKLHVLAGRLAARRLDLDTAIRHFEAAGKDDTATRLRETAEGLRASSAERERLRAHIAQLEASRAELQKLGQTRSVQALDQVIADQRAQLEKLESSIAVTTHVLEHY